MTNVATATALKDAGNAAFGAGDVDGCLGKYREAIAALGSDGISAPGPARTLLATLHSNSSNALLTAERWAEASAAAASAVAVLGGESAPTAPELALLEKARFRHARAEAAQGLAFSALCDLLLLKTPTPEVSSLRSKVAREVGLMGLDSAFGIDMFRGGFTAIAREDIPAETALFAEGQLLVGVDATLGEDTDAPTTESRVAAFVQELLRLKESEDGAKTYGRVAREMKGSWPRTMADVPANVLASVRKAAASHFAKDASAADAALEASVCGPEIKTVRDEVTMIALQARYNCFHRGFFRTCALLNHACDANAAMKYVAGSSLALPSHRDSLEPSTGMGVVTLVTCRRIAKGEPITVKYLNDHDFILGVIPRRELLRASWLFTCECRRCESDLQPAEQAEWLRCTATPGCEGFVHLPVAPIDGGVCSDEVADAKRDCSVCGGSCSVSFELRSQLHELRRETPEVLDGVQGPTGQIDTVKLHRNVSKVRAEIAKYCHKRHWLHTLCIYQFCVVAQRRVDQAFKEIAADPQVRPAIARHAAEFGLKNFDAASMAKDPIREPHTEIDALGLFLELEARMKPFYPDSQLWALHVAAGSVAVMIAALFPDRLDTVSPIICSKAVHFPTTMRASIRTVLKASGASTKQLRPIDRAL